MKQIAENIFQLNRLGVASAFLVGTPDNFILIDTGTAGKTGRLIAQLKERQYTLSGLKTIVLTHCHNDHAGGVRELLRHSQARVAAHRDEIPYLTRKKPLPTSLWFQGLLWGAWDLLFNARLNRVDIPLKDGDMLDVPGGGLRVIHIPGHTPGNIALYHPQQRVMFFGDVMFNEYNRLQAAPRIFNSDTPRAKIEAQKLTAYPIDIACFSHGRTIFGNAGEKIRSIL